MTHPPKNQAALVGGIGSSGRDGMPWIESIWPGAWGGKSGMGACIHDQIREPIKSIPWRSIRGASRWRRDESINGVSEARCFGRRRTFSTLVSCRIMIGRLEIKFTASTRDFGCRVHSLRTVDRLECVSLSALVSWIMRRGFFMRLSRLLIGDYRFVVLGDRPVM
jgi:hypothetical protein